MVYAENRKYLVAWLRKQLIGHFSKETLRGVSPLQGEYDFSKEVLNDSIEFKLPELLELQVT